MARIEATWGDIAVDSHIVDKTGKPWRIAAIDDGDTEPGMTGYFRMVDSTNTWVTVTPKPLSTPVTLALPESPDEPLIALLRDKLGAVVLGSKDVGADDVICPDWVRLRAIGVPLDEFRTHLNFAHGMYANDIKTFKRLEEAHAAAHGEGYTARTGQPHIHR